MESVNREIVQKRFTVRLTHRFEKDRFVYTFRDVTGEIQFSPRYETILIGAPYTSIVKEKQVRAMAGLLVMGTGLTALLMMVAHSGETGPMSVVVFLCLVALMASEKLGVFSAKCTLLKMEPPPPGAGKLSIRVIHDAHHDEIIAELKARWTARLRQLHLEVNPLNDQNREQTKFNWLRDNGVISVEEYDRAVDQLRSTAAASPARQPVAALN
jgi:hypothetical protein